MPGWLSSFSGVIFSWWGAFIVSAIDSSVLFVLPFGNDALTVYLVASHPDRAWLYPLIMAAGSLAGAAVTYWIGHRVGDAGLPRIVSHRRLDELKRRASAAGTGLMAATAILPPPFPLTPFVLTFGALDLNRMRFFVVFGAMRLVRFGGEALLAHRYGEGVLAFLHSDTVQGIVTGLVVLAVAGTIGSGVMLWRRTRRTAPAS